MNIKGTSQNKPNNTKTYGLMLLSTYSDDESEEDNLDQAQRQDENNICPISDSRIEQPSTTVPTNRLPLPSTLTQLFKDGASESNPQDDPALHDGRIRSFPHQRGNWSTYVYVPYEPGEGFEEMLEGLASIGHDAGVDLRPIQEPHISLTRTVVLLHHWIDGFVSSVKLKLSHFPRFPLILGSPAVYCNDERTRTFFGLKVENGSKQLCEMAGALDGCLSEFRLPPFYKDPQFHMSVLWVVGDARKNLEALLPNFHSEFSIHHGENPNSFCINVGHCMCKTGNKIFTFPLSS